MLQQAISTTLLKECGNWIDEKVKAHTYASRSHVVEVLILKGTQKE